MINRLLLFSFFVIWPIGTLPIILINALRNNKFSVILLSLFMGLLSMYYFPFGDQYRYWLIMQSFRYLSFSEAFDIESVLFVRSFNIINIALFVSAKIGLSIEQFRCIVVFISYLLVLNLYLNISKNCCLFSEYKCLFLVFFSIPYYAICSGFRTGFGLVLFCIGIIYIYNRLKFLGVIFVITSVLTHYVFLMYSIILFFSFIIRKKIKYKVMIIASCLLFVSFGLLRYLYGYNDFIDILIETYIVGEFGNEYQIDIHEFVYLLICGIFPLLYMYFINLNNNTNVFMENFIRICFSLIFLFCFFYTLFTRHIAITTGVLSICILMSCIQDRSRYGYKIIILNILMLVSFLLPFRMHWKKYQAANIQNIIFSSLPNILNNTYPDREIYEHIDYDGSFE